MSRCSNIYRGEDPDSAGSSPGGDYGLQANVQCPFRDEIVEVQCAGALIR